MRPGAAASWAGSQEVQMVMLEMTLEPADAMAESETVSGLPFKDIPTDLDILPTATHLKLARALIMAPILAGSPYN